MPRAGGATLPQPQGNGFSGRVQPGDISFDIDGYYTPYPDLIESLGDEGVFIIAGSGTLEQSGTGYAGELDGIFIAGKGVPWTNNWYSAACAQNLHRVVLTR